MSNTEIEFLFCAQLGVRLGASGGIGRRGRLVVSDIVSRGRLVVSDIVRRRGRLVVPPGYWTKGHEGGTTEIGSCSQFEVP